MVDFKNISADLQGRIEKIMAGDGKDSKKIDSRNEYNQLAQLLSGDNKTSGSEKTFVEGLMTDYEEEFMVSKNVKDRVLEIIRFGEANKADDNAEIRELKNFKKTNGLTKEEKNWIQKVIEGRVVKTEGATAVGIGATKETPHENKTEPKPEKDRIPREKNPPKEGMPKTDITPKNPEKNPKPEPIYPIPGKTKPVDPPRTEEKPPVKKPQTPKPPTEETKPTEPPVKKEEPAPPKVLNVDEINSARTLGKDVADFLVGYTMDAEGRLVSDIVKEQVNKDNVLEFIKGYTKNKGLGDFFFQQLESEYGFEEAQQVMIDIATKLKKYFEQHNAPDKAKEIDVILNYANLNGKIDEEQAKKLDELCGNTQNNNFAKKVAFEFLNTIF